MKSIVSRILAQLNRSAKQSVGFRYRPSWLEIPTYQRRGIQIPGLPALDDDSSH
jgi:hypothetical protein